MIFGLMADDFNSSTLPPTTNGTFNGRDIRTGTDCSFPFEYPVQADYSSVVFRGFHVLSRGAACTARMVGNFRGNKFSQYYGGP